MVDDHKFSLNRTVAYRHPDPEHEANDYGPGGPERTSGVIIGVRLVEDGVTGFLADAPEEWRDRLERLIADAGLRERMGRASRRYIGAQFSITAWYPVFKKVLEDAGRHGKGA